MRPKINILASITGSLTKFTGRLSVRKAQNATKNNS
jgi:hypothetical protein